MNSTIAKTAVLLIDPYNDFLDPAGKVHGMIAESLATTDPILKIQAVVAAARVKGIPIYYGLHQQCNANFLAGWKHATGTQKSQEAEKAFEAGSWGAEIFPGLQPDAEKGDVVVGKHWCSSSFSNTDLDYQLRQKDVQHVVLAGMVANSCLESTGRYAYELGYQVTMLSAATAGVSTAAKDAAVNMVWPLFADEVITAESWIKSLQK